jgi:hypothetical protein
VTGGRRKAAAVGLAVLTLAAAVAAGAGASGPVPGPGPKAAAWIGISLGVVLAATLLASMALVLRGANLMPHAGQDQEEHREQP